MTLLADFDWQAATQADYLQYTCPLSRNSPLSFQKQSCVPKTWTKREPNCDCGHQTQTEKKSMIFNLEPSDPIVIDISCDAVGQPLAAFP